MEQASDKHQEFAEGVEKIRRSVRIQLGSLLRGLNQEIKRCKDDNEVADLARAYVVFREAWKEQEESISAAVKEVEGRFATLAEHDFPEALETSGQHNIALADLGRTISVQVRTKASIKSGAKEEAIDFFRSDANAIAALEAGELEAAVHNLMLGGRRRMANAVQSAIDDGASLDPTVMIGEIRETTDHLEGVVVEHIFPQTLSSLAKSMADQGKELPENIFTTFLQPNTTWRKLTSKSSS